MMNPNNVFVGDTLVQSYLGGPGMNQRSVFRWAVANNYPGLPTYSLSKANVIDAEAVRPFISIPASPAGLVLTIQDASLSDGDYEVFAEKHMNENFPDEINSDWVAEYNKTDHTITIQREGGATVVFSAGSYDPNGRFVVAHYFFTLPEEFQALVPGAKTVGVTSGLPTTSGYTLTSTTNTGVVTYVQDRTRTITKVYSNGDPTIVTTDYPHIETPFNTILTVHEKTAYTGGNGSSLETSGTKTFRRVWEYRRVFTSSSTTVVVNNLGGGVTETVTTEVTGDFLGTVYDWQLDTQDILLDKPVGGNKVFIYKVGGANAVLNALNPTEGSSVDAEFFPVIPVRLDNKSITEPEFSDLYAVSKKLYKRATKNQKLSALVTEVEDNEDLEEIDYAYIQWGISLNAKDNDAKRYLYTFWKNLIPVHGLASTYISSFVTSTVAYTSAIASLDAWIAAQGVPAHPLFGTVRPTIPSIGAPKTTTLRFKTDHALLQDFDNRISFSFIDETDYTGLGKIGAVRGDFWLVQDPDLTWTTYSGVDSLVAGSERRAVSNKMSVFSVFWQNEENEYKRIRVYGAVHQNFIYGGKYVNIPASEALSDLDESGFIIPLHYPSLKEAGLVSSTQLATCNTFIVFNSYQVFKKKWYQSFLGMLFLIIVIVAAAAFIAPSFVGGISGAFGTNAAVGAGLGLTGTASIVGEGTRDFRKTRRAGGLGR
jgi:hypothetical protein